MAFAPVFLYVFGYVVRWYDESDNSVSISISNLSKLGCVDRVLEWTFRLIPTTTPLPRKVF